MKKIIALIVISLSFLVSAQAPLQVPPQLRKLTDAALTNFPKMHALSELVRLSELKTDMSAAGYLPIVSVDGSYIYLHPTSNVSIPVGPGVVKSLQMNPGDNYSAMLNVVQPLVDFRTPANMDRAKSDVAVSEATRESYRSQLAYQVAQLYYGIIFLNRNIAVQQLQLSLVKSTLNLIEAKFKNGDALTYDLVTTQVRYTNIENYITELQTQLSKQYTMLRMLTAGNEGGEIADSTFSDAGYELVRDSVLSLAFRQNHDLLIAQNKITYSELDVQAAKRGFYPSLNFVAAAGYKNGFAPAIFDIKFNYDYGLSLSVPIMPPSRPSIQAEMAQVGLESAKDELQYQKIVLSKDVANALDDIRKNEKKLKSMDTLLQQARLAVDLATERFKEGVITSVELLTAETNLQDAQLSKLQTEYNLLLSKLELNRLAGRRWW
jgi:outer membrane protein TolC